LATSPIIFDIHNCISVWMRFKIRSSIYRIQAKRRMLLNF